MALTVRTIDYGSADYDAAIRLRRRELRAPLGLDFAPEQLAAEAHDLHLACFDGARLVATVVLSSYNPTSLKLRQMVVDTSWRCSGIGSRLIQAAESLANDRGASRIILSARVSAQGFYTRHGYAVEGEGFTEVTIPHVRMVKALT